MRVPAQQPHQPQPHQPQPQHPQHPQQGTNRTSKSLKALFVVLVVLGLAVCVFLLVALSHHPTSSQAQSRLGSRTQRVIHGTNSSGSKTAVPHQHDSSNESHQPSKAAVKDQASVPQDKPSPPPGAAPQPCQGLLQSQCAAAGSNSTTVCAWSVDKGCFAVNFSSQAWLKMHGCYGGYTNQWRGMEHLLQTMRRMLSKLPKAMDVVLVTPQSWLARAAPFPPGIDGSIEKSQLYSQLFNIQALQDFVRSDSAMGDNASGGFRSVIVVERAPVGLPAVQHWATHGAVALSTDVLMPCGNQKKLRYPQFVAGLPQALFAAAATRRVLEVPCMYLCAAARDWEFAGADIVAALRPPAHLEAKAEQLLQLLRAHFGGNDAPFGAVHLRLERDMCNHSPAKRPKRGWLRHVHTACRFTATLVEQCMLTQGIAHSGEALYVASGSSVLTAPAFAEWKASSTLKVATKLDVQCPPSAAASQQPLGAGSDGPAACINFEGLGREELAAIEVFVLSRAAYFVGSSSSSMSKLVLYIVKDHNRPAIFYSDTPACVQLLPTDK